MIDSDQEDGTMDTRTTRTLTGIAVTAWLMVAGYGVRSAMVVGDDAWRLPYAMFSLALLVGVVATVALAAGSTRPAARPRLRVAGLAVCALGCLGSVVAWALPLWMTLLAVGLALVTAASPRSVRRACLVVTAGELLGLVVLYGGLIAKVGRQDEWGDYPLATGFSLVVVAAITVAGLVRLARSDPAGTHGTREAVLGPVGA
jgi:hypothetical protein